MHELSVHLSLCKVFQTICFCTISFLSQYFIYLLKSFTCLRKFYTCIFSLLRHTNFCQISLSQLAVRINRKSSTVPSTRVLIIFKNVSLSYIEALPLWFFELLARVHLIQCLSVGLFPNLFSPYFLLNSCSYSLWLVDPEYHDAYS